MTVLAVIPDVTQMVVEYLRTVDALKPLIGDPPRVTDRQVGRQPLPCITVSRIGGSPTTDAHWAMGVRIQVDTWADLQQQELVVQIAATAQAAMADRNMIGVHAQGVVSGVRFETDVTELPDPVTARPRALFDARVFVHPNP